MRVSPTLAERLAMKTAWAALNAATSPNSEMVETIVFGLGSAGLLMDPEKAVEVDRLRAEATAAIEWIDRNTPQPPLAPGAIVRVMSGLLRDERALQARVAELEAERASTNAAVAGAAVEREGLLKRIADPAPAADSPAARLAAVLRDSQPDVVLTEVIDDTLLRLHVKPQSLDGWRWWLDHLTANVGSITHKGAYATCTGELDGVRVLMAGFGVGDLQAAAHRDAVEAGERA